MIDMRVAIADFPDYEVSSSGEIFRVKPDHHGRIITNIMKPTTRPDGYLCVTLHRERQQYTRLLHRVVCFAFHGNPPEGKPQCAHIDGVKSNNCAENLRWSSASENNMDKVRHGTMPMGSAHPASLNPEYLPKGELHANSKLTADDILSIRSDTRPQSVIAAEYGVSQSNISFIKTGKGWKHI